MSDIGNMTMKIQRLRIESFKRFRKPLEIDGFTDGLNLFAAPNESGKSTIAEAIRAAFLERHRSGAVDYLRPWGEGSASPSVDITFTLGDKTCPAGSIAPAFAQWRMLPGLQPFLRVMALFNTKGLENFQFCALPCNHISEHEAIIVSMVCALRDSRAGSVHDTLALLVEEEAIGDCLASLTALGQAMETAAIFPVRSVIQTGEAAPRADNDRP